MQERVKHNNKKPFTVLVTCCRMTRDDTVELMSARLFWYGQLAGPNGDESCASVMLDGAT